MPCVNFDPLNIVARGMSVPLNALQVSPKECFTDVPLQMPMLQSVADVHLWLQGAFGCATGSDILTSAKWLRIDE